MQCEGSDSGYVLFKHLVSMGYEEASKKFLRFLHPEHLILNAMRSAGGKRCDGGVLWYGDELAYRSTSSASKSSVLQRVYHGGLDIGGLRHHLISIRSCPARFTTLTA